MEATAVLKYLRVGPQKARLVIDLIRGKRAEDALDVLRYTRKASAKDISKLLKSAVANAENTKGMDIDKLYVKKAFVDQGPTMKRTNPKAMGRANVVRKRMSHITIVLGEKSA
ncbi:MAG: 50S ribosomal protein L22 [Deltaproteobacteria bacterium GWC2_42_11]|nr:MAG: 50S ribosomal protein L22 [Deltaproteobacteria bacterium GWC2_42_11]HBO85225.1 50S ribosomal protein L22 [Deltaproteobacteria bacterium]